MSGGEGPRIIDRAISHYQSKELKRIEIEEWPDADGNPLVCFSTSFTLKDQSRLQTLIEKQSQADALAELLILKLVDEKGDKIFNIGDKHALRESVDANVVARIANQIMETNADSLEGN